MSNNFRNFALAMAFQKRITKDEIDQLPVSQYEGEIVLVDQPEQVLPAMEYLNQQLVVGVDTETRPSFQRGQHFPTALLQISSLDRCYLFRLNKVGMTPEMAQFFSNPKIKKVGLAFKDDLLGLMRLRRFKASNCVDLQKMVNDYGIVDLSLQKIFAIVFHMKMSKAQRLTNWEAEHLTEQQQRYSATDAWATLLIHEQLIHSEKLTQKEIIALKAEELALQIAASNAAREAQEARNAVKA